MDTLKRVLAFPFMLLLVVACSGPEPEMSVADSADSADYPRGVNGGRLLESGDFAIELSIFETGVPPEYHAWPTLDGTPIPLADVDLTVTLTRLGDELNVIGFEPAGDYLRGDTVIYEPHSFYVDVDAVYRGESHHWQFESLEGRTTLQPAMQAAFGIDTEIAGPATLTETLSLNGVIHAQENRVSRVSARFDGVIRELRVNVGDQVESGQVVAVVENNDNLREITVTAPISGSVVARHANAGEQTAGRTLLEIMDTSVVWAELAVFPGQRSAVTQGAPVRISSALSGFGAEGNLDQVLPVTGSIQAYTARVELDNPEGELVPGMVIKGLVETGQYAVPLAVRREGLQPFRDFTVVYTKIGNEFEVRMLDLGRQDETWVEVLGGLAPGSEYVTTNSYILKADVEKSGASHDH